MKYVPLLLLTTGILFSGCENCPVFFVCDPPPPLVTINIIDQNGVSETISNEERLDQYAKVDFMSPQPYRKVLRVYKRDDQGNISAFITSYHPNGQLHKYLELVNGRAYGAYREYYDNGIRKIEAYIIGGSGDISVGDERTWIFEGCSQAWDERGCLQAEFHYVKGVLEGTSFQYHTNGNIWKKIPFLCGHIEGVEEVFLDDGTVFQTTTYCRSEKDGPSTRYWSDGSIAAEECYQRGRLMQGQYFSPCGEKISEICKGTGFKAIFSKRGLTELQEFQGGVQEGCIKLFDGRGGIYKIYYTKNGLKHGEEVEFYPGTEKVHLSISWSQGKIHGVFKSFHPDGSQESQREMAANKKNGILTAWYTDGNLMMIEEYDHDKLVKGEYFKRGDRFPASTIIDGKGTATFFDKEGVFLRKVPYALGRPEV